MEGSETRCGWTGVDGGEDGRWRGARRGVDGCEDGRWRERYGVRTGVDGGEDGRWRGARPEGAKYAGKLKLKGLQVDMIVGEKRWTEAVDEACFRVSLKHASLCSEIFKKIGVEGGADGHYNGGKGSSCGWTEVVYEACFRVSLKHASLWDEMLGD